MMNKPRLEHESIVAGSKRDFDQRVQALYDEGWSPSGGMQVVCVTGVLEYYQSFVRVRPEVSNVAEVAERAAIVYDFPRDFVKP